MNSKKIPVRCWCDVRSDVINLPGPFCEEISPMEMELEVRVVMISVAVCSIFSHKHKT